MGSGRFFSIDGNETLGREESRAGRFLERRDYCKGHIVCHYLKALLGAPFDVYLLGAVGGDEAAETLTREMLAAGIDLRFLRRIPLKGTLFSLCLLYPDGSGGNLTTADSASSELAPEDVESAEAVLAPLPGEGMVLALPEVPLDARAALLRLGSRERSFRVASFTSREMAAAVSQGLLGELDLLAMNADEARALGGELGQRASGTDRAMTEGLVELISSRYPGLSATVTVGERGSFCWDGRELRGERPPPVAAVGTSGAGDAHLAGVAAGLAAGLPLEDAHLLGVLMGTASVLSEHSINPAITPRTLRSLLDSSRSAGAERISALLALAAPRGDEELS